MNRLSVAMLMTLGLVACLFLMSACGSSGSSGGGTGGNSSGSSGGGGSSGASLSLSQTPGNISSCDGSSSVVLQNTGDTAGSWSASLSDSSWLTLDTTSGSLDGGQNQTLNLTLKPNLQANTYSTTFTLTDVQKGTQVASHSITANLSTGCLPKLEYDISDDLEQEVAFITIRNAGAANSQLDWNMIIESWQFEGTLGNQYEWFTYAPSEGQLSTGESVQISILRKLYLNVGQYSSVIKVNNNTLSSDSQRFRVSSEVINPAENVVVLHSATDDTNALNDVGIELDPNTIEITQSQATREPSFYITNNGPSNSIIDWQMRTENNTRDGAATAEWINIDPRASRTPGGTSTPIYLTFKPGTKAGTYSGQLIVDYGFGQQGFTVRARLDEDLPGSSTSDFELRYDPSQRPLGTLEPGIRVTDIPLQIGRQGGFSSNITFSQTGVTPNANIRTTFNPNPATGDHTNVTLTIPSNVTRGETYNVEITGTGGGKTHTTVIPVTIRGEPKSYTLSVSPTSVSTNLGGSTNSTVRISPQGGFNSGVSLSASGAPSGVTVNFSPNPTTGTSTARIQTSSSTPAGQHTITIKGSGGGVQRSTDLTLVVNNPENSSISGVLKSDNNMAAFSLPTSGIAPGDGAVSSRAGASRESYVPRQILVQYHDDDLANSRSAKAAESTLRTRALEVRRSYNFRVLRDAAIGQHALIEVPEGVDEATFAAQLERDPRVAAASPNIIFHLNTIPNDSRFSELWHLPAIGMPEAWEQRDSSSKVVAVLDSGFDVDHVDLRNNIVSGGFDFCDRARCDQNTQTDTDVRPGNASDAHGTHVMGLIGATMNNRAGIAGVIGGGAQLLPIKIFSSDGFTTADAFVNGLKYAAGLVNAPNGRINPNPADIITMSLGTTADVSVVREAVAEVAAAGKLMFAASGNSGSSVLEYPAAYSSVMAIGSVNHDFERSCYSHYGDGLDLVVPVGDGPPYNPPDNVTCRPEVQTVLSTKPSNTYGGETGTSQATPIAAAVAALVWAENPSWSANQVRDRLKSSAYLPSGASTFEYGAGILRADRALGLPGPGDVVTIQATGQNNGDSGNADVTLRLNGSDRPYTITDLRADTYRVRAVYNGNTVSNILNVILSAGEHKQGQNLILEP